MQEIQQSLSEFFRKYWSKFFDGTISKTWAKSFGPKTIYRKRFPLQLFEKTITNILWSEVMEIFYRHNCKTIDLKVLGPGKYWMKKVLLPEKIDLHFASELDAVAKMATFWNVPIVGYMASSNAFADRSIYRTLARVSLRTTNSLGEAVAALLKHYGWKRVRKLKEGDRPCSDTVDRASKWLRYCRQG